MVMWKLDVTGSLVMVVKRTLPSERRLRRVGRLRVVREQLEPPHEDVGLVERLRLANALAEYCIAPAAVVNGGAGPAREPLEADAAAEEPDDPPAAAAATGPGAAKEAAEGSAAAVCGREQFVAAVRRQDPLAKLGLELDEALLDLAWRLLRCGVRSARRCTRRSSRAALAPTSTPSSSRCRRRRRSS